VPGDPDPATTPRAVPSSPQVVKTGRPFTSPAHLLSRLSHHVVSGQTRRGIRPSAEGRSARGAGFAINQNAYPWPVTATRRKWPLPGDPDASIGARHHRLPRFYLERFANEREQVATIDRRTGIRRTTAIKETAAEKDFYTAINTEGEKDGKTEHLLSHIEGNAARAIRNILSPGLGLFPPQPQDRADLCLFLAFQKVRGKLTRKRIEMLGDLWARGQIPADMTSEQAAAWLRAHEQEVTPESVTEMVELSASMDDFEFVPDPNAHLSAMGDIALRISELLLPRPWWVAEYDTPALLTSDEPVALHFRDHSRPPGHDRGIAYADEIWFPLDPRRLLILGRPDDRLPEQHLRPPADTAATVNLTVAAGAYECIYMHPAQNHLKGLRIPKPGAILQINGQMPIDLSRYNQPVTNTGTQRRR
jgi:hypothetical protein